ncbi:MAG: IreB family regulatory phosphoprotein [Tyzzerella sp.]|nr:IreB family regulatory phosphoprotein [Tyzzerella sp.]
MSKLSNTQFFQVENGPQIQAKDILEIVYQALREKGYNPVSQMVGYIMSGDPTYITSYNGARSLIMKMERDELVEEMLKTYIKHHSWE